MRGFSAKNFSSSPFPIRIQYNLFTGNQLQSYIEHKLKNAF